MRKQSIGGKEYYIHSQRDKDGKVRTSYLGNSAPAAKERTKGLNARWLKPLTWVFVVLLALGGLFVAQETITGFLVFGEDNVVRFPINASWNLSDGYMDITQNLSTYQELNLLLLVDESDLAVDLDNYTLSTGYVNLSLYINASLVDNATVYYEILGENSTEESVEEPDGIEDAEEEPVIATQEVELSTQSSPGFYYENSTGAWGVDHVLIEPLIFYQNTTLNCSNGSVNTNVNTLLYVWYLNDTITVNANASTLVGNFSSGDKVECGIVAQDSEKSLLGYWPFDEGAGNTAWELVENDTALLTSASWVPGRDYHALNLSTDRNATVLNSSVAWNASQNFTHSFWIYQPVALAGGIMHIGGQFEIKVTPGGFLNFLYPIAGTSQMYLTSKNPILARRWTHIALTYENTSATAIVYINGKEDNRTTSSGPSSYFGNLTFGNDNINSANFYLDEYAIYNVSLNTDDILSQYRQGISRLSRHHTLALDTTETHFSAGTLSQVNATIESGNITLSNVSATAFYIVGNITSRIFDLPHEKGNALLTFRNRTPTGNNVSVQVRSGVEGVNGSIQWSAWAGSDSTYSKHPNLILGVDFSGTSGNLSYDTVSNRRILLANQDLVPEGHVGSGLRLYGDGQASISDFASLRLIEGPNFTIELWIYPLNTTNQAILNKQLKYYLFLNGSQRLVFNGTFTGNETSTSSSTAVSSNAWSHIAVTHDADNNTNLYLNGENVGSLLSNGTIDVSTNPLILGPSVNGLSHFNGTLDDLAIYNSTLTAEEIKRRASGRFSNSSGGEATGILNRYVQYRGLLETDSNEESPSIEDVSIKFSNLSSYVYNDKPGNISAVDPNNSTLINSSTQFNWTSATDLENDILFYEFQLANDTNFSNVQVSYLVVNNFSTVETADDNNTVFVEHFDSRTVMQDQGWDVLNWSSMLSPGRWGDALDLDTPRARVRIARQLLSNQSGAVEVWVKPYWDPNTNNTPRYILDLAGDTLHINSTGTQLMTQLGAPSQLSYNISSWGANEWHHIAVSWQKNVNMTLFVDGEKVNVTYAPALPHPFSGFLYIGTDQNSAFPYRGVIDELRISNAERKDIADLNLTNITIAPGDYPDGHMYWRVRTGNYYNESLEGNSYFTPWDKFTVPMDTRTPTIQIQAPTVRYELSSPVATINVTTDEPMACESLFQGKSAVPFNFTGGLTHSSQVTLASLGNYSYLIQCNDTADNIIFDTRIFWLFNRSRGVVHVNLSNSSYAAGTGVHTPMQTSIGVQGGINFTTTNTTVGRMGFAEHGSIYNPENSTTGLPLFTLNFFTYFPDHVLQGNRSGNFAVDIVYKATDFSGAQPGNLTLYFFNRSNSTWTKTSATAGPKDSPFSFSTDQVTTFTLAGDKIGAAKKKSVAVDSGRSSSRERAADLTFDDDDFDEEISEERFLFSADEGEEEVIDIFNPFIGILDVLFTPSKSLSSVSLLVSAEETRYSDEYLSFSLYLEDIEGGLYDDSVISSLIVSYAIDASWMDDNGYSIEDIVLVDEEGNTFELFSLGSDEDYYYFESQVDSWGVFTITLANDEDVVDTTEEVEEEAVEEEEEEEGTGAGAAAEVPLGGVSAFFYTVIASMAVLFVSRIGLAAVLSRKDLYGLSYSDLEGGAGDEITMKHYIYANLDAHDLQEQLLAKGLDGQRIIKLMTSMKKLGRGELDQYIYQALAQGKDEEVLVSELRTAGWDAENVQGIIQTFHSL